MVIIKSFSTSIVVTIVSIVPRKTISFPVLNKNVLENSLRDTGRFAEKEKEKQKKTPTNKKTIFAQNSIDW